jgi:phage terminase large subunit-like protein
MSNEAAILDRLSKAMLGDSWLQTARPNQLPPAGDWFIWLLLAGRGFGKTRAAVEWVRSQIESGRARNVAIVGATAADVRDVIVEGPAGILAISPDSNRPAYAGSLSRRMRNDQQTIRRFRRRSRAYLGAPGDLASEAVYRSGSIKQGTPS